MNSIKAVFGAVAVTVTLAASTAVAHQSGTEYWVALQDADQIAIVTGDRVAARIAVPKGTQPHSIDISPSGDFAYVAGVGNGDLHVVDVAARRVVATLDLGPKGTHQARPTPGGGRLLVAQMATKQVVAVDVDESAGSWTRSGAVSVSKEPVCTAYGDGGRTAYVSMKPDGIAVIDTAAMTVTKELETDGAVQCGLAEAPDGASIYVSSNGSGGHLYRLDVAGGALADLGLKLGAKDLHGLAVDETGVTAYLSAREDDTLKVVALSGGAVRTVALDRRPGQLDKPDQVKLDGESVLVSMRLTGDLAVVNRRTLAVRYVRLTTASANAAHGVAVVNRGPSLPRTGGGAPWAAALALLAAGAMRWRFVRG